MHDFNIPNTSEASAVSSADSATDHITALTAPLTEREFEVLQAYAKKKANKQSVARDLVISEHTVHTHMRNIYEKLDLHTRYEVMLWFFERSKGTPRFGSRLAA